MLTSTFTFAASTKAIRYLGGIPVFIDGTHGQNGNGTLSMSSSPELVAGGLHFRNLSSGVFHTCGVTRDDRAYCWGWNVFGQLGDGTKTTRLRPRAVVGGHLFRQVSAGGAHTCGTTPSTETDRLTPVPAAGAM